MLEPDPLAAVAARAAAGDAAALDELCRELQDPIYRLAMRMFANPEDAADATQEALIRVVTHVGSFEGRSKITTWAYTVASRHFLRMKTQHLEPTVAGPEEFGDWIDQHRAEPSAETASRVEFDELCGDVRIACTYGMLLCLTRPLRLAYLLGDVIGLTDIEGAQACETTPAAFRQRLASARRTMRSIMAQRCGLISPANPCRCPQVVDASIQVGILDPDQPMYAHHAGVTAPIEHGVVSAAAEELDASSSPGDDVELRCRSIARWVHADSLWQRRAGAVTFVEHAATEPELFDGFSDMLFEIAHVNAADPTRWSQTSVGWLLRVLASRCPDRVSRFLDAHPELSREARINETKRR